MLKKIKKIISELGDFNHLFVGMLIMILVSVVAPLFLGYAATFVSAFYWGKEHWTFIRLGELKSLNPMNWSSHDRNQTLYVWAGVWGYTIAYNVLF